MQLGLCMALAVQITEPQSCNTEMQCQQISSAMSQYSLVEVETHCLVPSFGHPASAVNTSHCNGQQGSTMCGAHRTGWVH